MARKPTHPGAVFREDIMKPLNLSVTEAAKLLGVSRKALSEFINEKASLSPQMALRIIMPSPKNVNCPPPPLPTLSMSMPVMPMAHPSIFFGVRRSLLKNRQASSTTRKTLKELRMAARAPSLCDKPM